ncbi:MAG TPA: DUF3040 domain-containing protein [Micromonosporaceae bacterium]
MLSEREKRELHDIEQQLALEDPRFVLVMRGVVRPATRLPALWFAGLVVWIVAMTVLTVLALWLPAVIVASIGFATLVGYVAVRIHRRIRRRRVYRWRG